MNMNMTLHMQQRMSQRAFTSEMVNFAMSYGEPLHGNKISLGRKDLRQRIDELQAELSIAMEIYKKGGMTLVVKDNKMITIYRNKK